jgi:hypothetical protein
MTLAQNIADRIEGHWNAGARRTALSKKRRPGKDPVRSSNGWKGDASLAITSAAELFVESIQSFSDLYICSRPSGSVSCARMEIRRSPGKLGSFRHFGCYARVRPQNGFVSSKPV